MLKAHSNFSCSLLPFLWDILPSKSTKDHLRWLLTQLKFHKADSFSSWFSFPFLAQWGRAVPFQRLDVTYCRQESVTPQISPSTCNVDKYCLTASFAEASAWPCSGGFIVFRWRSLFCNLLLSLTFSLHYDHKGSYLPALTPTPFCLWCSLNNKTVVSPPKNPELDFYFQESDSTRSREECSGVILQGISPLVSLFFRKLNKSPTGYRIVYTDKMGS